LVLSDFAVVATFVAFVAVPVVLLASVALEASTI
jgi:hypothetical protein